ncbi:MAG: 4Fe-4S ferredoxin, partial [bacterium]|nr:4Fe-4S ferredoxin [bacterium]
CYTAAIELKNGQAVIGDMCAVCGRCATHCPKKAIKLKLDNPNAVDDVVRRIESVIYL